MHQKIFNETCEIDWNKTLTPFYNFVRGLSPYPGVWSKMILLDKKLSSAKDTKEMVLKILKCLKLINQLIGKPGTFSLKIKQYILTLTIFY